MNPYHDDGQAVFWLGDVREVLRGLPAESVNMCVTSPPYWSLRDYGVEATVWGEGRSEEGEVCAHEWVSTAEREAYTGNKRWQHVANGRGELQEDVASELGRDVDHRKVRELEPTAWGAVGQGQFCCRCGAWRGALGLEPAPELFVSHVVEVFREVRRVLRKDGTLWLNIGDSYAASGRNAGNSNGTAASNLNTRQGEHSNIGRVERGSTLPAGLHENVRSSGGIGRAWQGAPQGYKAKDLVGIPWMVAFALRADGWWLRQDIVWSKPNPMPESVRDRCTKSHEYLFLLSKSERYYSDFGAIREPGSPATPRRLAQVNLANQPGGAKSDGYADQFPGKKGRDRRPTEILKSMAERSRKNSFAREGKQSPDQKPQKRKHREHINYEGTRNKRSVWSIPTAPYAKAHFATFPPALVEPTIKAGCPEGGVVLDPFLGSGTSAMVARRLGRRVVGIDLNAEYLAMAVERMGGQLSMDAQLGAAG